MPASRTSLSATHLKASPSIAWLSDWGSSTAAPALIARCSNSTPRPSLSTVFSWRYQAKPSTPTAVILPPKQPYRSRRVTSTPARAAPMAAASPPGPDPTTRTSVWWTTGVFLGLSSINMVCWTCLRGPRRGQIMHRFMWLCSHFQRSPVSGFCGHFSDVTGGRSFFRKKGRLSVALTGILGVKRHGCIHN